MIIFAFIDIGRDTYFSSTILWGASQFHFILLYSLFTNDEKSNFFDNYESQVAAKQVFKIALTLMAIILACETISCCADYYQGLDEFDNIVNNVILKGFGVVAPISVIVGFLYMIHRLEPKGEANSYVVEENVGLATKLIKVLLFQIN